MNVTGWSLASRMKLPDHLFGNRELYTVHAEGIADATFNWARSQLVMPSPMCIWQINYYNRPSDTGKGYARIGLASATPTNEAEMDAAVELFPYFAFEQAGPNRIELYESFYTTYDYDARKGIVTGGKYIVIELWTLLATMRFNITFVVSALPTKVPGWPGAWPAG